MLERLPLRVIAFSQLAVKGLIDFALVRVRNVTWLDIRLFYHQRLPFPQSHCKIIIV
jgi:hypothetical protein